VINHRRSLPWGYGGVNICPTVVPAPDEDDIEDTDFDEILEAIFEADGFDVDDWFDDFIEYIDNQRW